MNAGADGAVVVDSGGVEVLGTDTAAGEPLFERVAAEDGFPDGAGVVDEAEEPIELAGSAELAVGSAGGKLLPLQPTRQRMRLAHNNFFANEFDLRMVIS